MNFYSKKEKKWVSGGKVKIRVLPPFQTKGMTIDSVGQLTKHLQEKMQKEFDLLNQEMNLDKKYLIKSENLGSNDHESLEHIPEESLSINENDNTREEDKKSI